MQPNEKSAFVSLLHDHAVGLDVAPLTPARNTFYFESLGQFTLAQVQCALLQLRLTSPHFPKPSDIFGAIIKADDGHADVEVAWALAQHFENQEDTVTWTAEIAEAWGVALPLLHQGDRVAARMAFKAHYERIVQRARIHGRPPVWEASIGFDAKSRRKALVDAQHSGHLTSMQVAKQIAGSTPPKGDPLLALEHSAEGNPAAAAAKESLAQLRAAIAQRAVSGESPDAIARRATAEAKQRAAAMVEEVEFPPNLPPLPQRYREARP